MRPALDDIFFDEENFLLAVKTFKRSIVQRTAAGLDGQLAVDTGLRSRKLVQTGQLRAKSQTELQRQIDSINSLIDGQLHTLKCPNGRVFENLLIETFETETILKGGAYVSCEYRITYVQQG
jgi:hypothetical protein